MEELAGSLKRILEVATGLGDVSLIECGGGDSVEASREQWNDGSNTLAIAPGKVCVYERNVVTNEVLRKAGVELCVIPIGGAFPRPWWPALHEHAVRARGPVNLKRKDDESWD